VQLQGDRRDKRTSGNGARGMVMIVVALAMLSGVAARLAYLQVVKGDYNREMADHNRIRLIPNRPPRGRIYDRYGRMIADNKLSYSVFLEPLEVRPKRWPEVLERLSGYVGVPVDQMAKKLRVAGYSSPYPVRILQGADAKLVTLLRERSQELPGIKVDVELLRIYPNGKIASHLIGYTGEISEEQLATRKEQGYRLGDIIGKAGVERLLDPELHGQWGGEQVEVDAAGQVMRVLGEVPTQSGKSLRLTLDLSLQKAAESALSGHPRGAVVVMDPRNGEILAIASSPTYDPNLLSGRIAPKDWKALQSADRPLLNRALRPYPTASTFKVIMTVAALESGKFNPGSTIYAGSGLKVGNRIFKEHDGASFGSIGFVTALAVSSDVFFYQVGLRIGPAKIAEWATKFGFGERTDIGLPSESWGVVPTAEYKMKHFHQRWFPGDTANFSIGQGMLLSTPLQNVVMVSAIANGGYRLQPHLLLGSMAARDPIGLSPSTLATVRRGMRAVVTTGTAHRVLNGGGLPPNAGKTGSAEHGLTKARQTHAVFVGFAPYDKPEIAVSVFLENGGHGGSDAAPIARTIYRSYFAAQRQKAEQAQKKAIRSQKPVR
jgi:penicillin-binding protein 2